MNKLAGLIAVFVAIPLLACAAESADSSDATTLAPRQPKSSSTKNPSSSTEPSTDENSDAGAPEAAAPARDGADDIDPANLPGAPGWSAPFMPPAAAHQGACSAAQIDDYMYCSTTDWLGTECQALAGTACGKCVETPAGASAWGPIVYAASSLWINTEGCVASVAGSTACASKIYAANTCLTRCSNAKNVDECVAYARTHICQTPIANAESCAKASGMVGNSNYAPCGDPLAASATDDVTRSTITYFCGQ